jgi:hypothetical protein
MKKLFQFCKAVYLVYKFGTLKYTVMQAIKERESVTEAIDSEAYYILTW